jgi:hypothetical protein
MFACVKLIEMLLCHQKLGWPIGALVSQVKKITLQNKMKYVVFTITIRLVIDTYVLKKLTVLCLQGAHGQLNTIALGLQLSFPLSSRISAVFSFNL